VVLVQELEALQLLAVVVVEADCMVVETVILLVVREVVHKVRDQRLALLVL
jgi:hypothetical protein